MQATIALIDEHRKIVWALMLRELATRYGRNNLGFLWVIFEPLIFCGAVLVLYRAIRGPYEHGIQLVPFVFTGYMPMILMRHMVSYAVNGIKVNSPLLYHRLITIQDLLMARVILEFIGVTLGFILAFTVLLILGFADLPKNVGLMYLGWSIQGVNAFGFALIVGALSEIEEAMERIIGVTLYILVPVSGTFVMADWLPPDVRQYALLVPFMNDTEMIRSGYFGSAIRAYYNVGYSAMFGVCMILIGLLLLRHVRERLQID